MPARRFFIEGNHADGETVPFDASDAHKIVRVLRLSSGDIVTAVDSTGTQFEAVLDVSGTNVRATLRNGVARDDASPLSLTIAQAVPKGAKMDFIVEKLGELGVASLIPVVTARTVARDPADGKVERWRRLARAAAQQSGGSTILDVEPVVPFEALLGRLGDFDAVLLPWESADARPPRETLPSLLPERGKVLAIVGPEGGFTHDEAAAAQKLGAHVISLGRRIYRTESAALVLAAIVGYLSGD